MTTTKPAARERVRLGGNFWRLWTGSVSSNLGDGIAMIAYLWLASAVTRNPLLIALIGVAQRLPWLLFTLPAGVITDRLDRRKIMVSMDVLRAALTFGVAATVLAAASGLPGADEIASGIDIPTNVFLYSVILVASLLFGMAEVLRDNTAQTFLPAIVDKRHLERANGNMWGAEMVANSFIGPPLGSVLLGVGFAVPFFITGGTFAVAAAMVFLIAGDFRPRRYRNDDGSQRPKGKVNWVGDIKEGFGWLWRHPLLRPMAIILGIMNALGMMLFSVFVLFAQEELDLETGLFTGVLQPVASFFGTSSVGAFTFSLLLMGGAVGGIVGAMMAPRVSKRFGSGPSLYLTMILGGATSLVMGLTSRWWVVWLMFVAGTFGALVWNVITVSLRQSIIPDELLGRVNSVYRFFAWGMMPVGSLLGGVVVAVAAIFVERGVALRWPFFVVAAAYAMLLVYAVPRLTTAKIEAARAEAPASSD
jgi:MFS family permease